MRASLAILAFFGIAAACSDTDSRPPALTAPQTLGLDTRDDLAVLAASSADAALRDFDNDGILDLAITTYTGKLELRLGKPSGGFAAPTTVDLPGKLTAIAAGDLDNDLDLDLIVLRPDKQLVTSLVNDGRAGFHIAANAPTPPEPVDLLLCRAIGDKSLDLVVAALGVPELGICEGKGDCSFHVPTPLPMPDGANMVAAVAGDLTGDGREDLVVVDSDQNMIWFYPGTAFGFVPYHGSTVGKNPIAAAIGDVNRDGKDDLVVSNLGDLTLSLMLCNGVLPDLFVQQTLQVSAPPGRILVGDVTGDKITDIAVGLIGRMSVALFAGRGDGSFEPEVRLAAGGVPTRLLSGDVDRDGLRDLISTGGPFGNVGIWRARAPAGIRGALEHRTGLGEAAFVAAADFDRDGVSEIAAAGGSERFVGVLRLVDTAKPFPTLELLARFDLGHPVFQLTKGDLNQDGRIDLVVSCAGGLRILANRSLPGKLAFELLPVQLPGVVFPAVAPFEVVPIDLEGDKLPDLVVADAGSDKIIVLHALNEWFEYDWQAISLPVDGLPGGLAVADFTGDGYADIAVSRYKAGKISILANDTTGTFQALTELPSGAGPIYLRAADFDSDGWNELVVSAAGSDEVRMWFLAGSEYRQVVLPAGHKPTALLARDLNGDGRNDILVATLSGADFRVMLGDGRGGFPLIQHLGGSYRAVSADYVDLTGDGKPDLALGALHSDRIAILSGSGQ